MGWTKRSLQPNNQQPKGKEEDTDKDQLLKMVQAQLDQKERQQLWSRLFAACQCRSPNNWVSFKYFPIQEEEGDFVDGDIREHVEEYAFPQPVSGYEAIKRLIEEGRILLEMKDGMLYISQQPGAITKHKLVIIGAVQKTDDYMAVPVFYTSMLFKRHIANGRFLDDTFDTNCRFLVFKQIVASNL